MNDEAFMATVNTELRQISIPAILCGLGSTFVALSNSSDVTTPLTVALTAALVGILAVLTARSVRLAELTKAAEARGLDIPGGRGVCFQAKGRA